jgi:hypothetical protein
VGAQYRRQLAGRMSLRGKGALEGESVDQGEEAVGLQCPVPACAQPALIFRHSVNAATRTLLGPVARIALTSVYFGLSHIHGTPSGLAGVLLTGAFGVILAWAIERTRGYGWNWVLHGIADLTIFATLIAATA